MARANLWSIKYQILLRIESDLEMKWMFLLNKEDLNNERSWVPWSPVVALYSEFLKAPLDGSSQQRAA